MVAKRTARAQRTQAINQARALIITGPDGIRTRFTGQTPAGLIAELAALRPRPGTMVRYHTLLALRELGRRAQFPGGQLGSTSGIVPLVAARAPVAPACSGSGRTPPMLLIDGRGTPRWLRSEAAWAHLCGRADPGLPRAKTRTGAKTGSRRQPGQPRPMADRDHPDGLAPADPRLRRPAQQGRPVQARDHPLPQTLRSP
jgi:hypothetical protein